MNTFVAKCLAPALLLGTVATGMVLQAPPAHAAPTFYYDQYRDFGGGPARGELTWSGDVDETTIVYLHRQDVRTRTVHGKDANNVNTQVFGRLPDGPLEVFLRDRSGRGTVRVVQQPTPDNDFTAAVRIHDPQAGRGHYEFVLAWRPLPPPGRFGF